MIIVRRKTFIFYVFEKKSSKTRLFSRFLQRDEPSHENNIDAHDYISWHGKTCSQRVGELPRKKKTKTDLIKL